MISMNFPSDTPEPTLAARALLFGISYKNSLIHPFSNHVKVVEIIPHRPGLYYTIGRTAPRRTASANRAGENYAGVFFPWVRDERNLLGRRCHGLQVTDC
jgi:hypothetical protein